MRRGTMIPVWILLLSAFFAIALTGCPSNPSDTDKEGEHVQEGEMPQGSEGEAVHEGENPIEGEIVTEGEGEILAEGEGEGEIDVTPVNHAPVANAGADPAGRVGSPIALNGATSADADGDALTYAWTLISRPTDSASQLSGANTATPQFTPDIAGLYTVQLIVNDGETDSAPDSVTVEAAAAPVNHAPVANAGVDQNGATGTPVTLNGYGSIDADNDALTYTWTLIARPRGSSASLTWADTATPQLTPDGGGVYTVQLIVNDGETDSAPDAVTITVTGASVNRRPVADAGADQTGMAGTAVTLGGLESSDADNDALAYAWTLIARPSGSTAALTGADTASPQFVPDSAGDYVAELTVNDGVVDSAPDTVTIVVTSGDSEGERTALYDYVHTPAPEYTYGAPVAVPVPSYNSTVYWTDMTSGSWGGGEGGGGVEGEADRLWRHTLGIVRPPVIESSTALLMITGGRTGSIPDSEAGFLLLPFSVSSRTVTAVINAVPNEPLQFSGQGGPKNEDGIIAYSFVKYIQTGDTNWPALFPMVRAAVRAMDTVQQQMWDVAGISIDRFVVMGASKRGWTTWLTGASDARVCAVAPMVISILNMKPQIEHHYASYGAYSTALWDYWENEIIRVPPVFTTEMEQQLLGLVDPDSYRSALTMPKLIVNSTGDQFFLPDATRYYFEGLSGEKFIYNAPNTDHGLSPGGDVDPGVVESIYSFYNTVAQGTPMPTLTWRFDPVDPGSITVDASIKPKEVRLWQATNPDYRDFRLEPENITPPLVPDTTASPWTSVLLTSSTNQYTAQVPVPAKGWTAFYVEAKFANYGSMYVGDSPVPTDFRCTTECRVIPDVYP